VLHLCLCQDGKPFFQPQLFTKDTELFTKAHALLFQAPFSSSSPPTTEAGALYLRQELTIHRKHRRMEKKLGKKK
jgi:hypothetical protein